MLEIVPEEAAFEGLGKAGEAFEDAGESGGKDGRIDGVGEGGGNAEKRHPVTAACGRVDFSGVVEFHIGGKFRVRMFQANTSIQNR